MLEVWLGFLLVQLVAVWGDRSSRRITRVFVSKSGGKVLSAAFQGRAFGRTGAVLCIILAPGLGPGWGRTRISLPPRCDINPPGNQENVLEATFVNTDRGGTLR